MMFQARFTASRMKPKSEEVLGVVRQRANETLREYVECFNKEDASVRNLVDKERLFWMKDGFRKGSLFQIDVGVNKPRDLGVDSYEGRRSIWTTRKMIWLTKQQRRREMTMKKLVIPGPRGMLKEDSVKVDLVVLLSTPS